VQLDGNGFENLIGYPVRGWCREGVSGGRGGGGGGGGGGGVIIINSGSAPLNWKSFEAEVFDFQSEMTEFTTTVLPSRQSVVKLT
jgi:hypothetical protein